MQTPLADSLYEALASLLPTKMEAFLATWRSDLENQLLFNPGNLLPCHEPTTAWNITDTFPSTHVLKLYVNPCVNDVDTSDWKLRLPDLSALALFADQNFSWAQDLALANKFRAKIWSGYFTHQVLLVSILLSFSCFSWPRVAKY